MINSNVVFEYFNNLQTNIVETLQIVDGKNFINDSWQRKEGGGGTSCLLENGNIFERAGVGFSHVVGDKLPDSASAAHPEAANRKWEAMGLSLVLHPRNPYAPTVHMNVRFFIAKKEGLDDIWWFGGGMDLTPYYGFDEDAVHFHQTLKTMLDPYDKKLYSEFKKNCDEYFYLKHRKEPRGIGGIFYDDFNSLGFDKSFNLNKSVGDVFLNAYLPILQRRKDIHFTEKERDFQLYRRGRYVEFNLIFDRGTLFGLQSNGRAESILMSMPPMVQWKYDWKPETGSKEEKLYTYFLTNKDWLSHE
ncbi:HemF Coproporphyrinogen III oxidase [Candidatus Methylopumilus universalis]|uniref:oxygen-dependent coproporphyrinogen oxidase n=1 Tax=Candidatus Methylopumilus universalis TaxID=2588536 RepID=UPI003BEF242E